VNGVDVSVLVSREMYFDQHGKPITTSLKDHTKAIIKNNFASLDDFLNKWNTTDRKEAIIAELQEQGVMVEALYEAVNKEVDLFDLICHVAFDQPPLTRQERANNVKKRNYFTKYGDQAKKVLEELGEKGYEAYLVGGCARDLIMGREPEDWDITTNAKPEEILKVFPVE
jgi:type I restriction enzyme R subunit